jgi:hypothetical protein
MNTAEIIVIIMLTVWSILMIAAGWNNHGRKRKYEYTGNIRKIKRKYVNKIGYYVLDETKSTTVKTIYL